MAIIYHQLKINASINRYSWEDHRSIDLRVPFFWISAEKLCTLSRACELMLPSDPLLGPEQLVKPTDFLPKLLSPCWWWSLISMKISFSFKVINSPVLFVGSDSSWTVLWLFLHSFIWIGHSSVYYCLFNSIGIQSDFPLGKIPFASSEISWVGLITNWV